MLAHEYSECFPCTSTVIASLLDFIFWWGKEEREKYMRKNLGYVKQYSDFIVETW